MNPASEDGVSRILRSILAEIDSENSFDSFNRDPEVVSERPKSPLALLEALETTLRDLQELVQAYAIDCRRLHNSRSPVNRIPTERFLDIVSLSLRHEESHLGRVQDLSKVSSGWRAAIDQTPLLWSTLSSRDPINLTYKALANASTCPLRIICSIGSPPRRGHWTASAFVTTMLQHVEDWKSASLEVEDVASLLGIQLASAPRLQDLSLKVTTLPHPVRFGAHRLTFLFGNSAKLLTSLELERIAIPWDSLNGLKILRLSSTNPTLIQLLNILSRNPSLTSLSLKGVQDGSSTLGGTNIVQLPKLAELEIWNDQYTLLPTCLLSRIHAPSLATFSLHMRGPFPYNGGPPVQVQTALEFTAIALSNKASNKSTLKISLNVTFFGCKFTCNSSNITVRLTIPAYALDYASRVLMPVLPDANIELSLEHLVRNSDIESIIRLSPVTTLRLAGRPVIFENQLEDLLRMNPALQKLTIGSEYTMEHVVHVLRDCGKDSLPLEIVVEGDWDASEREEFLEAVGGPCRVGFGGTENWDDGP